LNFHKYNQSLIYLLILTVISTTVFSIFEFIPKSFAIEDKGVKIYPLNSKPYGISFQDWTAKWWQWVSSIPFEINPLYDSTGKFCNESQSGPVWFLAGSSFPTEKVARNCEIPSEKSIFFPVINIQTSFVENPMLKSENELRQSSKIGIDIVRLKEVLVDGIKLSDSSIYRISSPLFNFTYPKDSITGTNAPGSSQAVSDGYWVMLEPLSKGLHTIQFKGQVLDTSPTSYTYFVLDVTYNLSIV
jgi:hypothetical protein